MWGYKAINKCISWDDGSSPPIVILSGAKNLPRKEEQPNGSVMKPFLGRSCTTLRMTYLSWLPAHMIP